MKQFTYTVTDKLGIHARPAGDLVKVAKEYNSTIKISCNGKTVDAKRLIALMSLGAKQNHVVTVEVEGDDENAAAEKLEAFFKENL
ncbi:MAG: HPr family phosphocarrier protein [Treponema sp.]|nr:HPr family phosphocarrier protein [Treponema sp.]